MPLAFLVLIIMKRRWHVRMKNFGPLEQYQFHASDTVKKYLQKIADRNDRVQHPQLHIMVSYPGEPTEEEKQRLLKDFEETLDSRR